MTDKYFKIFLLLVFVCGGIFAFYFLFWPQLQPQIMGEVETSSALTVIFFDVGQGDSALLRTPQGQDILIDGGPDKSVVQKLGEALPPLDRDLELVVLSHPHSDHVTGLTEVLKRYQVKKILMTGVLHTAPDYIEFLKLIREKNIPVLVADKAQDLQLEDNLILQLIYPTSSLAQQRMENLNNSSLAFKINYVSTSFEFMGDLEEEESLLSMGTSTINTDVLKVGHHGSQNANDEDFLLMASPTYAVISVGANNSYGLPSFRVIHNLEKLGAKILRTDQSGDIEFTSDGQKVENVK